MKTIFFPRLKADPFPLIPVIHRLSEDSGFCRRRFVRNGFRIANPASHSE